MANGSDIRIDTLKNALKHSIEEYRERVRAFSNLDSKAQQTSSVDGIFLAATFAFMNSSNFADTIRNSDFIQYAIIIIIGFLTSSVIFCLFAMIIRPISLPMSPQDFQGLVHDTLKLSDKELEESLGDYLNTQFENVIVSTHSTLLESEKKANMVLIGQVLLVLSIIAVSILIVNIILCRYS